jgi:hypothetical protein
VYTSYAFSGITVGFPYTVTPFCQSNTYEYYIVGCQSLAAIGSSILSSGVPCARISTQTIQNCTEGYFAVAVDVAGAGQYNQACYFKGYWYSADPDTGDVQTISQEWSATRSWLQTDSRSVITFTPDGGGSLVGRVLLLGANHTV